MTKKKLKELTAHSVKKYHALFGYAPKIDHYVCGDHEYITFLEKAVEEEKELSNYLKEK